MRAWFTAKSLHSWPLVVNGLCAVFCRRHGKRLYHASLHEAGGQQLWNLDLASQSNRKTQ